MAEITAALVKDLREKTGAGMMDCKNALSETKGDIEAAIDWLRKKGLAKAAKKSGRVAAEGLVGVVVEANLGVALEDLLASCRALGLDLLRQGGIGGQSDEDRQSAENAKRARAQ